MPNHNNTRRLFAGCDAGIFTLPEQVTRARTAWVRLGEASVAVEPPAADPADVQQSLADALVTAAGAGEALVTDVEALLTATAAQERRRLTSVLVVDAVNRSWHSLATAVTDHAEQIIIDLQPTFTATVGELREVAGLVQGVESATDLAKAGDKVRKAWLRCEGVVTRYSDIRAARDDLAAFGCVPDYDVTGIYAGIRNLNEIWPRYGSYSMQSPGQMETPPWNGLSLRDMLIYELNSGAELWLPTPAQQDARWQEIEGPKLEAMRRSQHNAAAHRALAGG